jgi:hypothetical protein
LCGVASEPRPVRRTKLGPLIIRSGRRRERYEPELLMVLDRPKITLHSNGIEPLTLPAARSPATAAMPSRPRQNLPKLELVFWDLPCQLGAL